MVQSGTIHNENYYSYVLGKGQMSIHAFPFGRKIQPAIKSDLPLKIAIIHEYKWIDGHSYPTAPKENQITKLNTPFRNGKMYGYDVIVYGDNHKGFITKIGYTTIINCGTLMRRASDEIDYKPMVGLLYEDKTVKPYYLDISKDQHLESTDMEEVDDIDMADFIQELAALGDSALDFTKAIQRYMRKNKTRKKVKDIILEAIDNG